MGNLSSNTLFHYTSSMDNLLNILINGFSPRICIEKLNPFERKDVAIPMTCFCDIPLSKVVQHSKQYGSFGIRLSKQWGKRKGISPVMYFQPKSNHIRPFLDAKNNLYHLMQGKDGERFAKDYHSIMYSTWFYKPYEGVMWRDSGYTGRIRFYDEKEWRYVPPLEELLDSAEFALSYRDEAVERIKTDRLYKSRINEELAGLFTLGFGTEDIKYIILNGEGDKANFISLLKKTKFTTAEIEILSTKLMTMEAIKEDF